MGYRPTLRAWHREQVLPRIPRRLLDSERRIRAFADTNADTAVLVAYDDRETEVEAAAAGHHARHATRLNGDLVELAPLPRWAWASGTAPAAAAWPTATAKRTPADRHRGGLLFLRSRRSDELLYRAALLHFCFLCGRFHRLKAKPARSRRIGKRFYLRAVLVAATVEDNGGNTHILSTLGYSGAYGLCLRPLSAGEFASMGGGERLSCHIIDKLYRNKAITAIDGEARARVRLEKETTETPS